MYLIKLNKFEIEINILNKLVNKDSTCIDIEVVMDHIQEYYLITPKQFILLNQKNRISNILPMYCIKIISY